MCKWVTFCFRFWRFLFSKHFNTTSERKGTHRENRLILLIFWKHLQQRFCFAAMFSPRFYRYRRRFTAFNLVSFNWFSLAYPLVVVIKHGPQGTISCVDVFSCFPEILCTCFSTAASVGWLLQTQLRVSCCFLSSRHRQFVPSHYPENWNWGASIPPTPDSHSYITWSFKHHPKKQSGVK